MTKLNYTVNLEDKEKKAENEQVKHSMNSLSKQAVINQSLASRMPTNAPMNSNPTPIQNSGFGRTV
jgi:hypothetical protein